MNDASNPSTSCAKRALTCHYCGTGAPVAEEGDFCDDCIEAENELEVGGKYSVGYALTLDDVYY